MNSIKHIPPEEDAPRLGAKSLAPLIAVFTLIILLTIVVVDIQSRDKKNEDNSCEPHRRKAITLIKNEKASRSSAPKRSTPTSSIATAPDVSTLLVSAKNLLAENKMEAAEDNLKTLIVFEPENMEALSLLGKIFYKSGRVKNAEIIFRRQVEIDPKNHSAYNNLASALAKRKRYAEAIEAANAAIGLKPDSGEARINLAEIYSAAGDEKSALLQFEKAAELLGPAIIPVSRASVFDNIRSSREFQEILAKASEKRTKTRKRVNRAETPDKLK